MIDECPPDQQYMLVYILAVIGRMSVQLAVAKLCMLRRRPAAEFRHHVAPTTRNDEQVLQRVSVTISQNHSTRAAVGLWHD